MNDDFDQLRYAIEEDRCAMSTIDDNFVDYGDIYYREDQEKGFWQTDGDQDKLASTGAIAARHDAYVRPQLPTAVEVEQNGKTWQNNDSCRTAYWNAESGTWVSYVNTGPRGIQGPEGPPGPEGPIGEGININGDVPTVDDLPDDAPANSFWYVLDDGTIWYWSGDNWYRAGYFVDTLWKRENDDTVTPINEGDNLKLSLIHI